jgi:hypothetical protein
MPEPERPPPEECANCGATIPRRAKACPECGADERTGWREASIYDGLELPDQAWRDGDDDEDATTKRARATPRVNGIAWYWWCVGAGLVVLLVLSALAIW